MALFNFTRNTDDTNNNENTSGTEKLPVVIQLNEEAITVSAEEAEGLTVEELFAEHGGDLGDVDRINRYIAAGQLVEASDAVVLGTVYRGSITSESKGDN